MDIDTNIIKLNLNNVKTNENCEKWIEQDILVPDNMPDALKIVNVNAIPYVNDVEIANNRAKGVGKGNYNIIYLSSDDKMHIRGLNVSYPFTVNLDSNNLGNKEDCIIDTKLKNIIFSLPNERKIAVKNEVTFSIESKKTSQLEVLKEFTKAQDIEYNKASNTFLNVKCKKKCIISSTEDVMLQKDSSPMYDILKIEPSIIDTEYKLSYNKLMLKGVINIKLLYSGQNCACYFQKLNIPFTSMIDIDNISENCEFNIRYIIRDLNARINPDIDQKTINANYKIEADVEMYQKENIEYIDDFYSRTRDLKYDVNGVDVVTDYNNIEKEITVSDTLSDVLESNMKIVEYDLDTSNVSVILDGNNIKISGIAKLNLLIQNSENMDMDNKSLDIMVENSIPIDQKFSEKYSNIKIKDVILNVIQNGESIDFKVIIKILLESQNVVNMKSINKIEDAPIDLKDISSINIYVVKPNDTIWKIAKKYKTSMNNIIQTNNLEDPNKIDIGQKILVIR